MRHYPARQPHLPNGVGYNHTRDRKAQRAMRTVVLERDGYQCRDCGSTQDLRACHIVPLALGGTYDPSNGITRCQACDMATDSQAR